VRAGGLFRYTSSRVLQPFPRTVTAMITSRIESDANVVNM